jgi:hypothetical protein
MSAKQVSKPTTPRKGGPIPIAQGQGSEVQRAGQILTASRSAILPKSNGKTPPPPPRPKTQQEAIRRIIENGRELAVATGAKQPTPATVKEQFATPIVVTQQAQAKAPKGHFDDVRLSRKVTHHLFDENFNKGQADDSTPSLCEDMQAHDRFLPMNKFAHALKAKPTSALNPCMKCAIIAGLATVKGQDVNDDLDDIFADPKPTPKKAPAKVKTHKEDAVNNPTVQKYLKANKRSKLQPEPTEDLTPLATPPEARPHMRTQHEIDRVAITKAVNTHGLDWVMQVALESNNLDEFGLLCYTLLHCLKDDGTFGESGYAQFIETLAKQIRAVANTDNLKALAFYVAEAYEATFGKRIPTF